MHHSNNVYLYKCEFKGCNRQFQNSDMLAKHMTYHRDQNKIYFCKVCAESFTSKPDYKCHSLKHNPGNSYFRKNHVSNESKISYKCDLCKNCYTVKGSLGNHMRKHIRKYRKSIRTKLPRKYNRAFICKCCNKVYTRLDSLRKHEKRAHKLKSDLHNAVNYNSCNKVYTKLDPLQKRERRAQKLKCDLHKSSKSEDYVWEEIERLFKCHFCEKSYVKKNSLIEHVKAKHNSELKYGELASFKCNYCEKAFYYQTSLKRHHKQYHIALPALTSHQSLVHNPPNLVSKGDEKKFVFVHQSLVHSPPDLVSKGDEKKFLLVHQSLVHSPPDLVSKGDEKKFTLVHQSLVHNPPDLESKGNEKKFPLVHQSLVHSPPDLESKGDEKKFTLVHQSLVHNPPDLESKGNEKKFPLVHQSLVHNPPDLVSKGDEKKFTLVHQSLVYNPPDLESKGNEKKFTLVHQSLVHNPPDLESKGNEKKFPLVHQSLVHNPPDLVSKGDEKKFTLVHQSLVHYPPDLESKGDEKKFALVTKKNLVLSEEEYVNSSSHIKKVLGKDVSIKEFPRKLFLRQNAVARKKASVAVKDVLKAPLKPNKDDNTCTQNDMLDLCAKSAFLGNASCASRLNEESCASLQQDVVKYSPKSHTNLCCSKHESATPVIHKRVAALRRESYSKCTKTKHKVKPLKISSLMIPQTMLNEHPRSSGSVKELIVTKSNIQGSDNGKDYNEYCEMPSETKKTEGIKKEQLEVPLEVSDFLEAPTEVFNDDSEELKEVLSPNYVNTVLNVINNISDFLPSNVTSMTDQNEDKLTLRCEDVLSTDRFEDDTSLSTVSYSELQICSSKIVIESKKELLGGDVLPLQSVSTSSYDESNILQKILKDEEFLYATCEPDKSLLLSESTLNDDNYHRLSYPSNRDDTNLQHLINMTEQTSEIQDGPSKETEIYNESSSGRIMGNLQPEILKSTLRNETATYDLENKNTFENNMIQNSFKTLKNEVIIKNNSRKIKKLKKSKVVKKVQQKPSVRSKAVTSKLKETYSVTDVTFLHELEINNNELEMKAKLDTLSPENKDTKFAVTSANPAHLPHYDLNSIFIDKACSYINSSGTGMPTNEQNTTEYLTDKALLKKDTVDNYTTVHCTNSHFKQLLTSFKKRLPNTIIKKVKPPGMTCNAVEPEGTLKKKCEQSDNNITSHKQYGKTHKTNSLEKHKKFFQCESCNFKADTVVSLTNHMTLHFESCNVCGRSFIQSTHLKRHMMQHPVDATFLCPLCFKEFQSIPSRNDHVIMRHPGFTFFTCGECSQKFVTERELNRHSQKHPQKSESNVNLKKFSCEQCGEKFIDEYFLSAHRFYLKHDTHIVKSFLCDKCGDIYFTEFEFHLHMLTHPEDDSSCDKNYTIKHFTCHKCSKEFTSEKERNFHLTNLCQSHESVPLETANFKFLNVENTIKSMIKNENSYFIFHQGSPRPTSLM